MRQYRAVVVRDSSRELPPLTRRVFDHQPALKVATVQHKIDAQIRSLGVGFLARYRITNQIVGEGGPEMMALLEFSDEKSIADMVEGEAFTALADLREEAFLQLNLMVSSPI